jgi:hypothetical protein
MKKLRKIEALKLDKDCTISNDLLRDWVRLIVVPTCDAYGVIVLSVTTCPSQRKGFHVYVQIAPPIHAELAWRLQFLLGDDARRCSLNRARFRAGFNGWNKLFECEKIRLRRIYTNAVTKQILKSDNGRIERHARLVYHKHQA